MLGESRTAALQHAITEAARHANRPRREVAAVLAGLAREGWTLIERERLAELAARAAENGSTDR